MRRATFILCVLIGCPSISWARKTHSSFRFRSSAPTLKSQGAATNWKEFVAIEGLFSALFPGVPQKLITQLDTSIGKVANHSYVLQTKTAIYLIAYSDWPAYPYPTEVARQRKMLDAGRDRMLAGDKNLKLISETDISVNGYPGREWMTEDGESISRGRSVLGNGKIYLISFSMEKRRALKAKAAPAPANLTELFEKTAEQFLGSFKLTEGNVETGGEIDRLARIMKEQPAHVLTMIGSNNPTEPNISDRVLNGRAVRLVQPPYPPIARAAHASGQVSIHVIIDLEGNVAAAQAVSGHPLLRVAAIKAAHESQFTPTQLYGKPVMVSGIIIYNFVAQ